MDTTPLIPQGRQVIESYGGGGFKVSGSAYRGSVLVFPEETLAWSVGDMGAVSLESLRPAWEDARGVEVLLLGCGPALAWVDPALKQALRRHGPVLEPMDSGAACRTYNILLSEERRVAAALIAID